MHRYGIEYAKPAEGDLFALYTYIASKLKVPETGRDQVRRIIRAVSSLDQIPERYPVFREESSDTPPIRRMNVDSFAIFYMVEEACRKVSIVRIVYGGRDLEELLS